MVKKKVNWFKSRIFVIIIAIFLLAVVVLLFLRGDEDNWILDERGVYILHGNPGNIPEKVSMQENALRCANELYLDSSSMRVKLNSQCLGNCFGYAVDVVHVPRIAEDDKLENQCKDYVNGTVKNFIEIDKNGEVVRVVQ